MKWLILVLGLFIIYWAVSWGWRAFRKSRLKAVGGQIDADEFESTMRKAQIIDLREKKDFDAGHILGARSLPYGELKQRWGELRKDLPVYLYDLNGMMSVSAATKMRKAGFEKLYFLKGGYNDWSGKTKKKKPLETSKK